MTLAGSAAEPGILGHIALREWTGRRDRARRKVAADELPLARAEALLRPWLALACRAGSDCPEFADELADFREAGLTDREARACAADAIAPLSAIRAALAAARDAALDKATPAHGEDPPRNERAAGLVALALAFGAAAYHPRKLAEAA